MTELCGSDGRAITNQGYQSDANGLQQQASNMMCQNRPGLGQMLNRMAKPAMGGALTPQMDYGSAPSSAAQDNSSLAVPPIYGNVELRAGIGINGMQVPSGVDAYSMFNATVQRHGRISWQGGRPLWTDLDYRNTSAIYGEVEPGTNNIKFNIECPANSQLGRRRDSILIKHGQNSDGSIQAEMVSSYPYSSFRTMPKAIYSGGISMQEVQQPQQQQMPQQANNDSIGGAMPGTPMNYGGMEQTAMQGNYGQNNQDQSAVIAAQQRQIEQLQQQNQQIKDQKGHPIRDGLLMMGAMGLGTAMQMGRQYMNGGGYYSGYRGSYYGGGYNRLPFVNGGNIPFLGNRRRR